MGTRLLRQKFLSPHRSLPRKVSESPEALDLPVIATRCRGPQDFHYFRLGDLALREGGYCKNPVWSGTPLSTRRAIMSTHRALGGMHRAPVAVATAPLLVSMFHS